MALKLTYKIRAHFGELDRSFRLNVTAAQGVVLRR
jgi:hypothetical protein